MRRVRVFHTESFRLAALFAVLFLGLAGILIATVYWIVDDTLTDALVTMVEADINTINNGFREKGLPEAIEIIQQRLGSLDYAGVDLPGGYIFLADQANGKLAGNLSSLPPTLGIVSLPNPGMSHEQTVDQREDKRQQATPVVNHDTVLGKGVFLADGIYLFVGRDTGTIAVARSRLLEAFAWITGAAIVLAACGGGFFSMQFLRRIDEIAKTCDAIVGGRFHDRIPVRGSDDELDRLANAINSMLDRIAALLDNLRQVSSDVAHDLRTPLTHLRQRLEQARQKSTTVDEFSTAVTRAIGDTDALLVSFAAILRISQIESGTRLAAFSALSLSDLLRRIYEMYRPVAEDRHQVLLSEIHDGVTIRGDSELLTQLFINLIENALRHTPTDTHIVIGLTMSEDMAIASVRDTGPGIPVEERDKVFRRFYRVMNSRSTPGNGLGLALAAAIINLHQARIELQDNSPGLCVMVSMAMV